MERKHFKLNIKCYTICVFILLVGVLIICDNLNLNESIISMILGLVGSITVIYISYMLNKKSKININIDAKKIFRSIEEIDNLLFRKKDAILCIDLNNFEMFKNIAYSNNNEDYYHKKLTIYKFITDQKKYFKDIGYIEATNISTEIKVLRKQLKEKYVLSNEESMINISIVLIVAFVTVFFQIPYILESLQKLLYNQETNIFASIFFAYIVFVPIFLIVMAIFFISQNINERTNNLDDNNIFNGSFNNFKLTAEEYLIILEENLSYIIKDRERNKIKKINRKFKIPIS